MNTEGRRSFVRKSVATSVSLSFTGLIRAAHGEDVTTLPETVNTTIDPWGETTLPLTNPWDDSTISEDTSAGPTVELSELTDFTLPTEVTVDPWSWFSEETVPCTHNWCHYLDVRREGGNCIPQKACKACGERADEDGETLKPCSCLDANGLSIASEEFGPDCKWFSNRAAHNQSQQDYYE